MLHQPMHRRQFAGAAAAAGALVLFEPVSRLSGRAHALVKITHAAATEILVYLPLYVAQAKGFFEQEGLEVTIYNAQQRTIALRAVIAGDALTYCGDPAEPGIARLRGIDAKNIGVLVHRAVAFLLAKPGTPKDVKQWKGKTIITARPPHTHVSFVQMLLRDAGYSPVDKEGLVWKPTGATSDRDNVQLRPVIMGSQLAALVAGQGDMGAVDEPDASNGLEQGYQIVFSFPEYFGPYFYTSIATTARALQKQEDLVYRFVRAVTKACMYGHKYPDRAAAVAVQRYYTSDPKIITAATRRIIADEAYPRNLVVSREAYEKNFNLVLVRTDHPAARMPFHELMDLRLAEKAAQSISAAEL